MARKPAVRTRGTISGRPAKATSWPRAVSTRATPKLGGRFPPPDQLSQSIRAIFCLPIDDAIDDPAYDRLGCGSAEPHVPPQQLPHIDVGRDDQCVEQLGALGTAQARELRREGGCHALAMMPAAVFEDRPHRGMALFVVEAAHDEIADPFVELVDRGHRSRDIARWRRL